MQINFIKTELAKQVEVLAQVDFTPVRAHRRDAGVDLRCCSLEAVYLHPGTVTSVMSGVKVWLGSYHIKAIPDVNSYTGFAGVVIPRSSNPGLLLTNTVGTIDEQYQGEIFMKWFNPTDQVVKFSPGQRVAQLLIVPIALPTFIEEEEFELTTTRGEAGGGSTGRM